MLTEKDHCELCDYVAEQENDIEKHRVEYHAQPPATLDESSQKPTPAVKPLPLYKCNQCSFATITTRPQERCSQASKTC